MTYGAETWTLTAAEKNALRRFERKVLRKIYGTAVDKEVWRIRCNDEPRKLMGGEDIVILHTSAYEDGTDRRFRNVGNYKPDAGELP